MRKSDGVQIAGQLMPPYAEMETDDNGPTRKMDGLVNLLRWLFLKTIWNEGTIRERGS